MENTIGLRKSIDGIITKLIGFFKGTWFAQEWMDTPFVKALTGAKRYENLHFEFIAEVRKQRYQYLKSILMRDVE